MTKIIFHTKEYFLVYENIKSILIKIITKFSKDGLYLDYRHIWIPRNQIEYRKKQYLNFEKGEFVVIYRLPEWFIEQNNLWDYYYPSTEEFKIKLKYLREL